VSDEIVSLTVDTRVQTQYEQFLRQSVDSVAVSDGSVSVEATSLSDVTGSDTRLH